MDQDFFNPCLYDIEFSDMNSLGASVSIYFHVRLKSLYNQETIPKIVMILGVVIRSP